MGSQSQPSFARCATLANWSVPLPADYAALEAARLARDPRDLTKAAYTINESQASVVRYQRSDYAVAKVFDDGRPNVIVAGGTGWSSFEAEARAGKLRDGMSDDARVRSLWFVAVLGCGAPAQQTRHRAELAIGGSLIGVMAGGLSMSAFPSEKPILIPVTITFGALAVAATVVYIIADSQTH